MRETRPYGSVRGDRGNPVPLPRSIASISILARRLKRLVAEELSAYA